MNSILTSILHSIEQLFGINLYITIGVLLITIISILLMCGYCLVLLLDATYRPNSPQYPFNIFLDRIIPFITILSPSLIILKLNYDNISLMEKFGYIIIIHIFLLIPLIQYWSTHRAWFNKGSNSNNIFSWKHPILFLCITIGITYPTIWGFYYSLLKYLRIGTSIPINLSDIFIKSYIIEALIITICLFPHLLFWLLFVISILNKIRNYFWDAFSLLLYSLHISLLKYRTYFLLTEKLYKLNFLYYNILSLNAPINRIKDYYEFSRMRRLINLIYYYPIVIIAFMFLITIAEVIFNKNIYYSNYILFWIPIIFGMFKLFNLFGNTFFIKDVCMVDYKTKNFIHPRYPASFWQYIQDTETFYGFTLEVSVQDYKEWQSAFENGVEKYKRRSQDNREKLFLRINGLKENTDFLCIKYPLYSKRNYLTRIKAAYYSVHNVRWFHSSIPLKMPFLHTSYHLEKFHPVVIRFCKTIPQFLALMDTSVGSNDIQKAANQMHTRYDLPSFFTEDPNILINQEGKYFIHVIEGAQISSFDPLTKKNVIIGDTKKMRVIFKKAKFEAMQQNPDVSFHFGESSFPYKSDIGMDFKNIMGRTRFSGRNQVSVGSVLLYEETLNNYTEGILRKYNIPNIRPVMQNFKKLAKENDWSGQLNLWAENIHKFPQYWAPSLYARRNLPLGGFKTDKREEIIAQKRWLRWLSNKAYELNIPEENFQESHIALLMAQDPYEVNVDTLTNKSFRFNRLMKYLTLLKTKIKKLYNISIIRGITRSIINFINSIINYIKSTDRITLYGYSLNPVFIIIAQLFLSIITRQSVGYCSLGDEDGNIQYPEWLKKLGGLLLSEPTSNNNESSEGSSNESSDESSSEEKETQVAQVRSEEEKEKEVEQVRRVLQSLIPSDITKDQREQLERFKILLKSVPLNDSDSESDDSPNQKNNLISYKYDYEDINMLADKLYCLTIDEIIEKKIKTLYELKEASINSINKSMISDIYPKNIEQLDDPAHPFYSLIKEIKRTRDQYQEDKTASKALDILGIMLLNEAYNNIQETPDHFDALNKSHDFSLLEKKLKDFT